MSYYMTPVQTTLNDDSGYDAWANLQVGSNGDPFGVPTTFVGDIYGEENWAYQAWSSSSTSFDTGSQPVSFDVTSSGDETLRAGSASPLTYQTGDIGPITSVVIEAAVQMNATASMTGISVDFLENGSVIEADTIMNGPQVDTVNSGSANVAEQTLTVTPSTPFADEVIVTGYMHMTAPGTSVPPPDAMFVNILIHGANASFGGSGGGTTLGPGGNDNSAG